MLFNSSSFISPLLNNCIEGMNTELAPQPFPKMLVFMNFTTSIFLSSNNVLSIITFIHHVCIF